MCSGLFERDEAKLGNYQIFMITITWHFIGRNSLLVEDCMALIYYGIDSLDIHNLLLRLFSILKRQICSMHLHDLNMLFAMLLKQNSSSTRFSSYLSVWVISYCSILSSLCKLQSKFLLVMDSSGPVVVFCCCNPSALKFDVLCF